MPEDEGVEPAVRSTISLDTSIDETCAPYQYRRGREAQGRRCSLDLALSLEINKEV
jgi:hypothetical protein